MFAAPPRVVYLYTEQLCVARDTIDVALLGLQSSLSHVYAVVYAAPYDDRLLTDYVRTYVIKNK